MSCWMLPLYFALATQVSGIYDGQLGSLCDTNQDCKTNNSQCNHGICTCANYFAAYNNTCLQSTLLGFDCVTAPQCSQKVAHSTCQAGPKGRQVCKCQKGFLQFRRHTCLSPATLGGICYSHSHCKMSNPETHCEFLIPKLFGRCACKNPLRRTFGHCTSPKLPPIQPSASTFSGTHWGRVEEGSGQITLGLACRSNAQCQKADINSWCKNGVCNCISNNSTCSAVNNGCHRSTFQCRGSGECISWYLVCDGQADCGDASDEECDNGPEGCPRGSYKCSRSIPRRCISAGSRCDGKPDCPAGEDETQCKDTASKGCPRGTYRCKDGLCLPLHEYCNAIIGCKDGSDESSSACILGLSHYCPFRCKNGRCRSTAIVCSGMDGCGDNSDEEQCTVCKCPKP